MGAVLPLIIIFGSALAATAAVYVAVTTVLTIAIIAAIASVAATVAAVYFYVEGDLRNSMLFAGIGMVAGIGAVYIAAVSDMAAATAQVADNAALAAKVAETAGDTVAVTIWGYTQAIYAGFQSFLEVIHFKTLLSINNVAYLLSADYRNMMNQVFDQISKVSEALGYGAAFMNLAFRDTRNLVMDISASMGKSYDLSEITWLSTYSDFLTKLQYRAVRYKNNPVEFLNDLDQEVYKPGVDAKAGTVQAILTGLDAAMVSIKTVAEDATRIKNDILRLAADMPDVIKSQVMPIVWNLSQQIDSFIRLSYDPRIAAIDKMFDALGADLAGTRNDLARATDKIARPGRLMEGIDDLPEEEKQAELAALNRVYNQATMPGIQEIDMTADWIAAETETAIFGAVAERPPEEKPASETKFPAETAPPRVEPRTTWFVGDY